MEILSSYTIPSCAEEHFHFFFKPIDRPGLSKIQRYSQSSMLRFLRTNRSIVSGRGERESGETLRLMSFLRYIPWGCFPKDFKGVAPEIRQSKHESRLPRRVRTLSLGHERDPRLGWLILAPGQHGFASRERNTGRVLCVCTPPLPLRPLCRFQRSTYQ